MTVANKLRNEIDEFVEEHLLNYSISKPKKNQGKVIHDTLWGTHYLHPHEVALLDTPLLQRLRQIRQTAFTYLTFPSAIHSRFEHTLGVLFQTNKLCQVLRDKQPTLVKDDIPTNMRLAALLHDCGHGPFSHTSENCYRIFTEMLELTDAGGEFEHGNPHEILAYLIINSRPFMEYMTPLMNDYEQSADWSYISNAIIGKSTSPDIYKHQFLNGPFDADKLDYLFRDSHFSGVKLTVDLDRLWHSVSIDPIPTNDNKRQLTVNKNGAITLEQILFCKMNLYATIYHHPKVRACDCMFNGIVEYCVSNGIKINDRSLDKVSSFLYLTDEKFFGEAYRISKEEPLHNLIHNLAYRRLFKRALVISTQTIDSGHQNIFKLRTPTVANIRYLRELAEKIWVNAGKPCLKEEIWIDLPKPPHNKEVYGTFIKRGEGDFISLNENFPIDEWVEQFVKNKWRGNVFCPPDEDTRRKISRAAREVLEAELQISFNDHSEKLCKIPSCES